MDQTRIFIVGAYGQLGKALQAKYPEATAVDRDDFDITDWEKVKNYDWSQFDIILNAAVFANVDGAETPEGRVAAWQVNAVGPSFLAKVATEHNLTLVHVSSDYVFDGTKAPHLETEPYTPLGVYAQTKAAGDIAVATAPKHYILRASWLIGDGPNFVRTMIGLAANNVSPTVVSDQVGRLTFASSLADTIDYLLQKKSAYGIYNASSDGMPASWADITRLIFKNLERNDLAVTNTTTEEYFKTKPNVAPRPLQSELDLNKIKATGFALRDWRDELREYIQAQQTPSS